MSKTCDCIDRRIREYHARRLRESASFALLSLADQASILDALVARSSIQNGVVVETPEGGLTVGVERR